MTKKKAAIKSQAVGIGQNGVCTAVPEERPRPATVRENLAQQVAHLRDRANKLEQRAHALPGALLDMSPDQLEAAGIGMYGF